MQELLEALWYILREIFLAMAGAVLLLTVTVWGAQAPTYVPPSLGPCLGTEYNGYLLTASHCILGGVELAYYDEEKDVGVISALDGKGLEAAAEMPGWGEPVIGYTAQREMAPEGKAAAVPALWGGTAYGDDGKDRRLYQVLTVNWAGCSGGPVTNTKGELLGMVVEGLLVAPLPPWEGLMGPINVAMGYLRIVSVKDLDAVLHEYVRNRVAKR